VVDKTLITESRSLDELDAQVRESFHVVILKRDFADGSCRYYVTLFYHFLVNSSYSIVGLAF